MAIHERLSKHDLATIFNMSLDMICIADINTATFLKVNPAFKETLGFEEEEFLGRPFFEFIHPDDVKPTQDVIEEKLRRGQKVINFQNRYRCKEGGYRWLNWVSHPVPERGITFAVAHDITEEKKAAERHTELIEALRSASELLNTVLDAIPDVIGVQDAHHRVLRYNRAGYAFLGLTPSEVRGRHCYELIGHESPCAICATSEVYLTKRVARVEKYVQELDTWLDVRAYPVLDETGSISQVIEHLRDITREKRAEAELRDAHERLLTILDSIEAHVLVVDAETWKILFANEKMRKDFHSDFTGSICFSALLNRDTTCDICCREDLAIDGEGSGSLRRWEWKSPINGRWYSSYGRTIRWTDGRLVRLHFATDITDVKAREEERTSVERHLRQVSRFEAIGTLAGGIAHDFNNLLMGIEGRTSMMIADIDSSHPFWEDLASIGECVKSATNLTRQILGFARGGKYEIRPIDLNELVRTSSQMFGRTRKEIRIYTQFQTSALVVEADRTQIEQVLLNMYVNAWQAMPHGGDLRLCHWDL